VLLAEDVLKVDFGVHVNGRIVDSAFTMTWEPTYDRLLEAVKDATNAGVRVSLLCPFVQGTLTDAQSTCVGSRNRRSHVRYRSGDSGSHGIVRS
jgi:methionine aminopeptidase